MHTYFAPAKRSSDEELLSEIKIVNGNPVMETLLKSVSGLLAILDENRQIIAINDSFLNMLNIDDASTALGLRPGEAMNCIHAKKEEGGCGTSKFCSTCGSAIAIVTSLTHDKTVEKKCVLTTTREGKNIDIVLQIRAQPFKIDNLRFILLFMQDITRQQEKEALERTFFHDIRNILSGIIGASELLSRGSNNPKLPDIIKRSSYRLQKEIEIQECLSANESGSYLPLIEDITISEIFNEFETLFASHPLIKDKKLDIAYDYADTKIKTDISLLLRILINMIKNALEATDQGGVVKVWINIVDSKKIFYVHNTQTIPEHIARRIFQRNFSTKEGSGRGIGTFSMKLCGESILGGEIDFTSTESDGTIFTFSLPIDIQ